MKSAMQELIDELDKSLVKSIFERLEMEGIFIKALEKEKEQIIQAHGLKYYDIGEVTITGENYYNQTYNQKQHIIDIMKADEDDGLYNQNKS
jgi:hypothetical protein